MITRVRVENYRSLAEVDVELGPLTVLVGPNGSGKSNFVDVLRFLRDAMRVGLERAIALRDGFGSIVPAWLTECETGIDVELQQERIAMRYGLSLKSSPLGGWIVTREDGGVPGTFVLQLALLHSLALTVADEGPSAPLKRALQGISTYTLPPAGIGRPLPADTRTALEESGENLSVALRKMKETDAGAINEINEALAVAVPEFTELHVLPEGPYATLEFGHCGPDGQPTRTLAEHESDGTLRMLAILCALYQTPAPSLIVIEEPELYVHPGALAVLAEEIQACAYHRTQVLITTHSPDLISHFSADSLRAVELVDGATQIGRIADHQREAIEKQLFSGGDILRMEGLYSSHFEESAR